MSEADALIARLGLKPHPEGGHYVETYRDRPEGGGRGTVTAIYYLLKAGETSHWHRVDATEIWHFHAGDPLRLRISEDGKSIREIIVDANCPQGVVPPHAWQAAEPLGEWVLVGCTVAPAFEFSGFEMAPPHWQPGE